MKEIIIPRSNIWIIFSDNNLVSKPICRVKTINNNEEYDMGIYLLKIGKCAINENELIDKNIDLPTYNLMQFLQTYTQH